MPDAPPTTLPNVDLQGYTPPTYQPLNQSDVAAVTNPPPPIFKASNTDIQAVAGTQKTVIPAAPPVFGSNPPQAQVTHVAQADTSKTDTTGIADFFRKRGDQPITDENDPRLTQVSIGDQKWNVHKEAAPYFQGFLKELADQGAPLSSSGGWNYREKVGARGISEHAFAGAIDVNQVGRNEVTPAFYKWLGNNPGALQKAEQKWGIYGGERFGDLGHFEWGGVATPAGPTSSATTSASGTVITPGQPSSDPGQLQIGPSGPIPAPPVPGLTATDASAVTAPGDTIKQLNAGGLNATRYGYQGDPQGDPESLKGNGAYVKEGGLVPGYDVALNAKAAAMVGNPKPGSEFQYAGRTWRYGDKVPEKYSDARFDIFDPHGQFGDIGGGADKAAQAKAQTQPQTTQPSAFGMRVASPEEAQKYDQYIQNGGDPDQIPVYDRLAVAIAKDPNFLTKPENFEEFYGLVYKPLQAQNAGEQFLKALGNVAPGMWQTIQNVGAAAGNAIAGTYDQAKIAYQSVTGQGTDEATVKDLAQRQASMSAGLGQGVSDAYDFLSGIGNGILNLPKPILDTVVGAADPAAREQMDRGYAGILQNLVGKQQQVQSLGKALQQVSAHAYGQVNVHAGELVSQATPDPNVVAGTATLANPLNVLPIVEGMEAVTAFKPVFFERAVNLGEEAAGAAAKKAALDSAVLAPTNVMEHATNPGFADAQNVRAQFMPQQAAAEKAATQTQNDLAAQLTRIGKTEADPGTATGFLSQVMQTGGKTLSTVGDAIKDPIENLSHMMSMGSPTAQKIIYSALDKVIFGALLEHMGPLGTVASTVLEHGGEVGQHVGDVMSAMGKELAYGQTSLPYWTRVAQQTKLLPKEVAAALDSPLVQTATAAGRGAVGGAATNAALGALSSPLNPIAGAVGGAAQGGILGMAGGGFGQWQRFQSPGQYMLAARGDWKRYRDTLEPAAQKNFDQLSPTNQLIMGQAMQHFPGLNVRYVNQPNGPRGNHFVDPQGRSSITINLAHPESAISGIMAHELTHSAATHGQLPDIYNALLGNPRTGQPGQYTLLDGQGKPAGIDPSTGHYMTNQEFGNLKNQYVSALGQSGIPTSHLTDLNIAREIYAEHGVDYMLSGGAIQDAASSFRGGSISQAAVKTALAKIGYTFDDAGNLQLPTNKSSQVTGSGLFRDMQRNPTLGKLATTYFQKKYQSGAIASEEMPTRRFSKRDMANPNVAETSLQNASEIRRDADGNVMRDPLTGQPILRSAAETKEYNAGFAAALQKGIDTLSPEQRAEMGHQVTSEGNTFVRYLPSDVLDGLTKSNQYNPHQIASLRMLSNVLSDKGNPGMEVSAFYHKALSPGKKYGQFEGSEKTFVPYGIEITKDGNTNVKAVDFNQLNNNYLKARGKVPYKDLWKSPSEFTQDAHTYFVNHSEGRPGADGGLGQAKRDAINALGNFQTTSHKETNPLVDSLPRNVRSIIKSYRIDRANQMQATGSIRPFISEEQYQKMNTNYLPRASADIVKAPPELREQTPERQALIADTQAKAKTWLDSAGPAPAMSTATYLTGDKQLPPMKTNQDLGEYINANHPKADISKPAVREEMSHAFTYDVMHALTKDGNALGWYGDTVNRAMNEVSKVDPDVTANPKNEMMFKLGLAVSSQGQKVHPNFETAYHVFQYFKEHGEMPTDRANFGPSKGGKDAPAMEENFAKINRLHQQLGTEGLNTLLNSKSKVRDLERNHGVTIGGDAADEEVVGSKILGPKVGAFYANLNGNFDPITMDLWLARGIHRMTGEMFNFSEDAYREQIGKLKDFINNDEVPPGMTSSQKTKILRQIDALEKVKPGTLTRERVQKSGKAIDQWAQSVHDDYKKNIPGRGSYKDGTPAKRTAKALDERVNKISDDPGGVTDRSYIKDIYARAQDNMKDAGIDIPNADLQALTWYREQELFKKAGVLQKGSDNIDYLDGAYALRQKYGQRAGK